MSPPPLGGLLCFLVSPSSRPSMMLFRRYLWYALMDSTKLVSSAFWDKDELISFWGQKVKGQRLSVTEGPVGGGIQSLTPCL